MENFSFNGGVAQSQSVIAKTCQMDSPMVEPIKTQFSQKKSGFQIHFGGGGEGGDLHTCMNTEGGGIGHNTIDVCHSRMTLSK